MHTMNSTEQNKGGNFCMNNEKTYKLMGRVGGGTLALGIIVLVTGVVTGILTIVNGARLLKEKSGLMF